MPVRLQRCVLHEDCRQHPELGLACGPCEVPTAEERQEGLPGFEPPEEEDDENDEE